MATRVIHATEEPELASAAVEAAEVLNAGGLVGFATETVYGIAALATRPEALSRLREIKSRPDRPFTVHIPAPEAVSRYVRQIPPAGRKLISKAWPGPVTILLPVGGRLAEQELQAAGLYERLCQQDVIGLRCPSEAVAEKLLSAVGDPVVAPSANPAGAAAPRSGEEVLAALDGQIDLLIDSGPTRYGLSSTIVRLDADGAWEVLREGVYDRGGIERLLRTTLLFVCTGNTCRSPMAAGLAGKLLAERLGCGVEALQEHGYEVLSAGVWAGSAGRATPEAVDAAGELGVDISGHRSRKLSVELINRADLILCMSGYHVDVVCRLVPSAAGKVVRLLPDRDITDPLGTGEHVYRKTAEDIDKALRDVLNERLP